MTEVRGEIRFALISRAKEIGGRIGALRQKIGDRRGAARQEIEDGR